MNWIDRVDSPDDLKRLAKDEVPLYCDALREFLIDAVSQTGGHLGSNLGVVELTVALHRVFDFKSDKLVLDTSHQVYPHKVITGRRHRFPTLRTTDGMSGFMDRGESPYDTFTSGHAGTAVGVAVGMAQADAIRGITDRSVVAIVGDASAGSGATFEALNHAGGSEANLLVILNDNQWSIARTVGGLRKYLNRIRTLPGYRDGKKDLLDALHAVPFVGGPLSRWAGNVKEAVANYLSPGHLFRELGWTYFGPENGHDVESLEQLLIDLRRVEGPVLLHCVTEKGRGYHTPGDDAAHAVGPKKLEPLVTPPVESVVSAEPILKYQDAFGRTMGEVMRHDKRIVAVTAAMPGGTGLTAVADEFPDRMIDVGICEQHALAAAAGMADVGLKPVVAIYSSFLQRGYDQVWQEVVIQGLPVVLAMDRAGIVGGDGVTHQGLYDIAFLRTFPDITIMAPSDPRELGTMLRHALTLPAPSALRYPRGGHADAFLPGNEAPIRQGKGVWLREGRDVCFLAYGTMVREALDAADLLAEQGIDAAVFNARFVRPLDAQAIARIAARFPLVLTCEEHTVQGGFGSAVLEHLATLPERPKALVRLCGVPDRLVWHGDAADWKARFGIDAAGLALRAERELSLLAGAAQPNPDRSDAAQGAPSRRPRS